MSTTSETRRPTPTNHPFDGDGAHRSGQGAGAPPPPPPHTIQRLPALLVNQIAAGEIIERPASVVKELVENAIDAGATHIRVTIEHGGRELIEVVDDGRGMSEHDLPMALAPHATSKIREAEDLDSIATLGFRGEAMASILSVSRMTVASRTNESEQASIIAGEGEIIHPVEPFGAPVGTTVTVRNLFFNTPARRKFLRTDLTEYNHVNARMIQSVLSNPMIGFTFINNEKTILDLPANQKPTDRVLDVLGRELSPELLEVNANERGPQRTMSLWGMIGTPALARGSNKFQHVFLNGRPIRDRTVLHAVKEAYRGLIDPTRFPMVVLYLEMDPALVDVNVHPAKAEVRFRDSQAVHGLLYATIRERLLNADITPALNLGSAGPRNVNDPNQHRMFCVSNTLTNWNVSAGSSYSPTTTSRSDSVNASVQVDQGRLVNFLKNRDPHRSLPESGFSLQEARSAMNRSENTESDQSEKSPGQSEPPAEIDAESKRVFQVHDSYLVVEDDEGISIVDQHALHERVMFEALKARILEGPLESQRLLIPAVVNLTGSQMELLEKMRELFSRLGIEAEPFGPKTLGIHAFPTFLFSRGVDPVEFVMRLFDRAGSGGLPPGDEEALHEVLDMMACKAAIKAGDRMSAEELRNLLELSEQIERAGRCPHGRPTTIHLSIEELEKQFGRR